MIDQMHEINESRNFFNKMFYYFYETIISPTKIFKNITKAEGVNVDF
jgi:hypothetical protein